MRERTVFKELMLGMKGIVVVYFFYFLFVCLYYAVYAGPDKFC